MAATIDNLQTRLGSVDHNVKATNLETINSKLDDDCKYASHSRRNPDLDSHVKRGTHRDRWSESVLGYDLSDAVPTSRGKNDLNVAVSEDDSTISGFIPNVISGHFTDVEDMLPLGSSSDVAETCVSELLSDESEGPDVADRDQTSVAYGEIDPNELNMQKGRRTASVITASGLTWNKNSKLWEAHIWLPEKNLLNRKKNGSQAYLGQYLTCDDAAQAHDKAAIKLRHHERKTIPYLLNHPLETYNEEMLEHESWTERDYLWKLRREAVGFTKGKSILKGVTVKRRKLKLSYEARISVTIMMGANSSRLETYSLGSFDCETEAGRHYDRAMLFFKGDAAVTNFRPGEYNDEEIAEYGRMLMNERFHRGQQKKKKPRSQ